MEAMPLYQGALPDCILMAVQMAEMDWIETTTDFRVFNWI